MNILVFTTLWPNAEQPNFATFVKNRMVAVSQSAELKLRVIAPIPYFPKQLQSSLIPDHWKRLARIPEREEICGLETFHPRYLVTPKIGMSFYARWLAQATEPLVIKLNSQEPIDLIDAHYAYPDGAAAAMLGERLNIPVVISARGTDLNLFPNLLFIRSKIQTALNKASGVIAVSQALKEKIVGLGIAAEKVAVIPNGVDRELFFRRDRREARLKLGIDPRARMVLTVGALVPGKGMRLLIEAVKGLSGVQLFVIGDGPERMRLQTQISESGVSDRVFLVGSKPNLELADWYSASDLFCLASQREGYPNVIVEALACGTPVIATDVGGIREMIGDSDRGRLVSNPTPEIIAAEIDAGLAGNWDRDEIANFGRRRSWQMVAGEVIDYWRLVSEQDRETRQQGETR